ncbi:hypothetical protein BDZ89DRAFT_1011464 [Hymenopellis radicata]|nr:hypothetical protein BDZ89DRAFT_1011464 [Hymenopellis radicata]
MPRLFNGNSLRLPKIAGNLKLTAGQISGLVSKSPWTKNFRHMLPVDIKHLRLTAKMSDITTPKVVLTRDRVKYWNIVPGDQIRVRGDRNNTLHTVEAINRWTNRVHLTPTEGSAQDAQEGRNRGPHVHYSKCQLYIGDFAFPPINASEEPVTRRVFARRLGTSHPRWDPRVRHFVWKRAAVAVEPALPRFRKRRIDIPWPIVPKPPVIPAEPWDTSREEVGRVTWRPPPFAKDRTGAIPKVIPEKTFLSIMLSGGTLDVQHPIEIYLAKELSNPHGFAKRHERWLTYQEYKKTLLAEYIERETKHLDGRTTAAARADAVFMCRERLEQERKDKVGLKQTYHKLKLERKTRRKNRKQEKIRARLSNMVLPEAPNQVLPRLEEVTL